MALVLPGGGARCAYQAGVLAGLAERCPRLSPDVITGVSAGSINAAFIANHEGGLEQASRDLVKLWANLSSAQVVTTDSLFLARNVVRWGVQLVAGGRVASGSARGRGLLDTSPLHRLLCLHLGSGAAELMGVQRKLIDGRLSALAITATSYLSGKALTFTSTRDHAAQALWCRPYREGRATRVQVAHVMASCALPVLFPAVFVDNEWCGDGGIRQTAPLSPAFHLGARRILAISTAHPPSPGTGGMGDVYPSTARVVGTVLNALMSDGVTFDAGYAARMNRLLSARTSAEQEQLRPVNVHVVQPSEDIAQIASECEACLPWALRHLTRGWGTLQTDSADILALLLFESAFTLRLIELGRADVDRQWPALQAFIHFD